MHYPKRLTGVKHESQLRFNVIFGVMKPCIFVARDAQETVAGVEALDIAALGTTELLLGGLS